VSQCPSQLNVGNKDYQILTWTFGLLYTITQWHNLQK